MDISPQDTTQQPISDDQELAKALAGVVPDDNSSNDEAPAVPQLQFEETPAPSEKPQVTPPSEEPAADGNHDEPTDVPSLPDLPDVTAPAEETPADTTPTLPVDTGNLDSIKKDVLEQLRPLIGKVELPSDEKFNVYLMLIRSTDDSSLIGPAHEAALEITDEKVRAQALLDIIKEIDYFSHTKSTTPDNA